MQERIAIRDPIQECYRNIHAGADRNPRPYSGMAQE